jgi:hypothetical protein
MKSAWCQTTPEKKKQMFPAHKRKHFVTCTQQNGKIIFVKFLISGVIKYTPSERTHLPTTFDPVPSLKQRTS